jgi:hypothetical protein
MQLSMDIAYLDKSCLVLFPCLLLALLGKSKVLEILAAAVLLLLLLLLLLQHLPLPLLIMFMLSYARIGSPLRLPHTDRVVPAGHAGLLSSSGLCQSDCKPTFCRFECSSSTARFGRRACSTTGHVETS